jgi:hypothetical protein
MADQTDLSRLRIDKSQGGRPTRRRGSKRLWLGLAAAALLALALLYRAGVIAPAVGVQAATVRVRGGPEEVGHFG